MIVLMAMSPLAARADAPAEARAQAPISQRDASCTQSPSDRYEKAVRVAADFGKYRGQCIDSNEFRVPEILSESSTHIRVANVLHDGRFWVASFPKQDQDIKVFEFLARRDSKIIFKGGHTELLITFKKPVKLVSQGDQLKTVRIRNFVYSVEAASPKDVDYSFFKGMSPNFLLVGRLLTAKQSISEETTSRYERYPLILGYQEKAQMLKLVLEQTVGFGYSSVYSTFNRNCTSTLINIADALPRFKDYQLGHKSSVSLDPVIGNGVKALKKRGLVGERLDECGSGIKDCRFGLERSELLN